MSVSCGDKVDTYPTAEGGLRDWIFGSVIKDSRIDLGFCPRKVVALVGSLDAEVYFFGAIGNNDVQNFLKNQENGKFLIRLKHDGLPELCVSYKGGVKTYDVMAELGETQAAQRVTRYYLDVGKKDRFLVAYGDKVLCCKLVSSPPKMRPVVPSLSREIQKYYRNIPREEIEILGKLDEGNNALVYKGIWKQPGKEPLQVALKKLNRDSSADVSLKKFIREVAVMVGLHHPNLVQLFGVVVDKSELIMVVEYVKGETLMAYLRRIHKEKRWLKEKQLVEILKKIASIMEYLHRKLFTHNDLTSLNVMVDSVGEDGAPSSLKVIDFGLAKIFNFATPSTKEESDALKGLNRVGADRALSWTDVGTFGRLMYNVCAHGDDMEVGIKEAEKFKDIIIADFPGCGWSKNGPAKLSALAADCNRCDAKDRPTFKEICARLESFYEEEEGTGGAAGSKIGKKTAAQPAQDERIGAQFSHAPKK